MRSRFLVGASLLIGILVIGTLASTNVGAAPSKEWVIANFLRPTVIAGAIVLGSVLIVHDDERMANGEPCTTVYRFDRVRGRQEKIVSFMCKPTQRDEVDTFTATCRYAVISGPDVLTEFQFAGDKEAHRVPSR